MKSIRIHAHGGPEVLKIDDIEAPEVRAGHALVKMKAIAMNHMDLWVRRGLPGVKIPLPIILGCEGSGVIEDVGAEIEGGAPCWKKGDEVLINPSTSCGVCESCLSGRDHHCRDYKIYGEHQDGLECEYKLVPVHNLFPKPKKLSFEEAAAAPLAFLTAWQMLVERAKIRPGQTALIIAAASGVGSAGVQIAKLFGARVIATAGAEEKFDAIRALGAEDVINHRTQDVAAEVKKITEKRGADVIFEHVGGSVWDKALKCLAFGGTLVTCGATAGYDVKIDLRHLFIKQQNILGSTMGPKGSLYEIISWIDRGKLLPVLDRVFSFAEVVQAHARLESGSQMGKVVLTP